MERIGLGAEPVDLVEKINVLAVAMVDRARNQAFFPPRLFLVAQLLDFGDNRRTLPAFGRQSHEGLETLAIRLDVGFEIPSHLGIFGLEELPDKGRLLREGE